MKYLKQGTVSLLENDTFRAKGVLYAHDLPKVLWCEQPEAGTEFTISYNAETGETVAEEINYVDLGLPSGLLWATCNVGATKPEETGLYFQWADVTGHTAAEASYFTWNNCPYQTVDNPAYGKSKFTKYFSSNEYLHKDSSVPSNTECKVILDLEDDAAYVNMGGDWRMPKDFEFDELKQNTIAEWIEINGVLGYKFISKVDESKYIFIPVSGYCHNGYISTEPWIYLWSSSLYVNSADSALKFCAMEDGINAKSSETRFSGLPVRGVQDPTN